MEDVNAIPTMSFTLTQALLGHDNVTTLGSILCFTLLNVLTKRQTTQWPTEKVQK
jgi:hypothetical protein